MRKVHALPWLALLALVVVAFVPSLTDFNTSDFDTTGNIVRFAPAVTNWVTGLVAGTGISTNNGTGTNNIFTSALLVNGTNSGAAFTSPASQLGSEQFGAGANGNGVNAIAAGKSASAAFTDATALGAQASSGQNGVAIGFNASGTGGNSTIVGDGASDGGFFNSSAFGFGAIATAQHQIMLGTATETVAIPNSITGVGSGAGMLITGPGGTNGEFIGPNSITWTNPTGPPMVLSGGALTANGSGVTNVPATGVSLPLLTTTWGGTSNAITMTVSPQVFLITATGNVGITNITGFDSTHYNSAIIDITNSTASTIQFTWTNQSGGALWRTNNAPNMTFYSATNGLQIPASGRAYVSIGGPTSDMSISDVRQ